MISAASTGSETVHLATATTTSISTPVETMSTATTTNASTTRSELEPALETVNDGDAAVTRDELKKPLYNDINASYGDKTDEGENKKQAIQQTLSPEGSNTSTTSSQELILDEEERKRRFSDIKEEEEEEEEEEIQEQNLIDIENDDTSIADLADTDENERALDSEHASKIQKIDARSTKRHEANDLNMIDTEADGILKDIEKSIKHAEVALKDANEASDTQSLTESLLESLNRSRMLILKLNLDKNLFKFQVNSELEQHNIEKQILLKNLETFQKNLNILIADNSTLSEKNNKLIKYYKNLKYGKFKDLKLQNQKLVRKLDSYRQQQQLQQQQQQQQMAQQHMHPQHQEGILASASSSSSSASSSGRNSVVVGNRDNMLNTLGMLASQVLASEKPTPSVSSSQASRSQSQSGDFPPSYNNRR